MITEWKPISRPQEQFLALPDTIKEAFFGGSAGPGKSECLMMYPIVRGFYNKRRFKALFMRRTYSELKLEIIPRSRELYEAVGGKFNKSDLVWEFESGALIFFGHCEHEDDVTKYDSMEINLYLPDETQSLLKPQYMYLAFTRVRSSDPSLPEIIRAAGMPGGIGHKWVKERFIDPNPLGGKIIAGKGGNKRIFIRSTLADNPRIGRSYSDGLESLPEAEKRAKKYGDWSSYEGQVFDEFRDVKYSHEPPNALHVIDPFPIPEWWPKIVVIDWGYRAMTWVGWGAISPDRRLYVYREQSWIKTKIEVWAPYVREFMDIELPQIIKICKSAGHDHGQEHTIQQQISSALGQAVQLVNAAHGSRIAGKVLLHEYLRWSPKYIPMATKDTYDEGQAQWILRNFGEAGYKNYTKRFEPPEEEVGIPKLQIFNNCPLLVNAIKNANYDKNKEGKPVEDVASWDGDDPYDGIRYLVDSAERYFEDSENEFRKVQARQDIVALFEQNQDWNALYHRSRILESQTKFGIQPVGRYRRQRAS